MPMLNIITEPVAEGCSADRSAEFTSLTSLTAGISSLAGLQYVVAALACGTIFALLGSLLFYETLRFAAMLLHFTL